MEKTAVLLMAKAPLPGLVKTRLGGYLSDRQCADLYTSFLLDIVDCVAASGLELYVAYTPAEHFQLIKGILPVGVNLFPQEGDDLGQRMVKAADRLFSRQIRSFIIIGADIPLLQPAHLRQAAGILEKQQGRICLGPAADGGYYLIGLTAGRTLETNWNRSKLLFDGISWGSNAVLAETLNRARQLNLSVELLPELQDIDRVEDLRVLKGFLRDEQCNMEKAPVRTMEYIETIMTT
ncbi:MAG: TIGR04282 family arsenosugar biosynthesis glycosyltransferase [Thermincola sp.]|jgi:rSAM/selenodomain-associated transferase 1|nr:TIGR04282 family arsenosugar biosynthesis glycosyltransferase [Thermincola sp.]MDT3702392.1 TIGR04282 family arsenosugar biosynthesis glycosyltransferase [Thermincola sp.]